MLIFFLLCTYLQTLQGKTLPPPLASSFEVASNATGVMACECPAAPDKDEQQLRTVYTIVRSCLVTIFACVWTSIHPNINGPRDSWWTCTKRRVVTAICAVIAPEIVLLWALKQRIAAGEIAEKYNRDFRTLREPEISAWEKCKQLFQPLPKSTTRRGDRQQWTITHGFFVQMGGFILYENEYPKEVLKYQRIRDLLRAKAITLTVTERNLQDRSKGEVISKAIVVLQATWFVLQCIVRTIQNLPLSELEVLTLAFAVVNAAIYVAWWNKPQRVDTAICIPLKQADDKAHTFHPAAAASQQTDPDDNEPHEPLMPPHQMQSDEDHMGDEDNWLRRMLRKDRQHHSLPVFLLVRLPYRIAFWLIHPLRKMNSSSRSSKKNFRLPMFFSEPEENDLPQRVACIIGMVFGGIHLLAWALVEFPLQQDRILWRISAIVLTATPFVYLIADALYETIDYNIAEKIFLLFVVVLPLYIAARFIIFFIALKAIIHPYPKVLLDVSWTRYIPHF